jgi:hypothetical protein
MGHPRLMLWYGRCQSDWSSLVPGRALQNGGKLTGRHAHYRPKARPHSAVASACPPGRPEYWPSGVLAVRSICGFRLNPRPARLVSPVAVSGVRKGLGSDEETGVRRTNAGLDRPGLHAGGALVRQARGGGPPDVRQARGGRPPDAGPLVPDPNRGGSAPAAAAVVSAAPDRELIKGVS